MGEQAISAPAGPPVAPPRHAFADYRRLLEFLRPHWWRMAGNIVCNVIAAALNTFVFTLLIPSRTRCSAKPS